MPLYVRGAGTAACGSVGAAGRSFAADAGISTSSAAIELKALSAMHKPRETMRLFLMLTTKLLSE
jgi:hypothetical protein